MDIGINPWDKIKKEPFWRDFCPQGAKIVTKLIGRISMKYKILLK